MYIRVVHQRTGERLATYRTDQAPLAVVGDELRIAGQFYEVVGRSFDIPSTPNEIPLPCYLYVITVERV